MIKKIDTKAARVRRHARVRKNISGTAERPRLNEGGRDKWLKE